MINLTEISVAIVTLFFSVISIFFIPYMKNILGKEKIEKIMFWVQIAVEAAEQIYKGTGRGREKKEYVLKFLRDKGFTLDPDVIENVIESNVLKLKKKEA